MTGLKSFEADATQAFAREWEALFDRGDYRTIGAFYTEDASLIATATETVHGRSKIERFWQAACEGAAKIALKRTVHVDDVRSAGDLGFMRGTVALRRPDSPIATIVRYVTLWQREPDGVWRISTDISSAAPPPG